MMLLSHDVCQPIPEELIVPYKIKPSIALIVHCYTIQSFNWVLLLHHLIEYFIIQIIFLIKYLRMAWRLILVWIINHFKFIFFKRPWLLCSFRRRDLLIRELLCLVLFKCVIQIVHPFPGPRQLNIFEEFSLFLLPSLSGTFFHSSLLFSESFLISSHLLPLHLHLSCSLFFQSLNLFLLLPPQLSLLFCTLCFSDCFKFLFFCNSNLLFKNSLTLHFFSQSGLVNFLLPLSLSSLFLSSHVHFDLLFLLSLPLEMQFLFLGLSCSLHLFNWT